MTKARTRVIRDQLRVIGDFLSACDLIGVVANPDDRVDEYDAYAPTILGKLQAGIDVGALAHYLHELASRQMGLRGDAGASGIPRRSFWSGGLLRATKTRLHKECHEKGAEAPPI
jgi:hypothetical protein